MTVVRSHCYSCSPSCPRPAIPSLCQSTEGTCKQYTDVEHRLLHSPVRKARAIRIQARIPQCSLHLQTEVVVFSCCSEAEGNPRRGSVIGNDPARKVSTITSSNVARRDTGKRRLRYCSHASETWLSYCDSPTAAPSRYLLYAI